MKVSPFIEPSRQARPTKRNKPLTRDFFSQLIKLETEFHNKTYTMTILDELIQFYAKAVEYYDKAKEEISGYFVFKIQDVLATKKSLKMLLDQNVKNFDKRDSNSSVNEYNENNETSSSSMGQKSAPHSKQYISENILEEISEEEDDEREEKVQIVSEKKRQEIRPMRKNRTSISTMKNQKQRFVNFFYKMETQKASEKQNMHLILDGFALTSDKNDTFVKRDIDNQKHILRRRLENRKAEVFMSQTINTQNSHFGIGNENIERKENEAILENFLEELDAEQFEEEGVEGKNEQILHDLLSNQTSLKEKSRRIKIQNNLQTNITDADIVFDSIRQNLEVDLSGLFSPKRNPGYFSPSSAQYKPRSKFF